MEWIWVALVSACVLVILSSIESRSREKVIKTQNELIGQLRIAVELRDALLRKIETDLRAQGIEITIGEKSTQHLDG